MWCMVYGKRGIWFFKDIWFIIIGGVWFMITKVNLYGYGNKV